MPVSRSRFGITGFVFPLAGDYPSEANVINGVSYGDGAFTGTYVEVAESHVRFGVGYGPNGTTYTGASVAPSENDVRLGVDYGYVFASEFTGNLVLPATSDVRSGIQYGSLGTEFTGSLV